MSRPAFHRGFTLIELMIAVAIIALLSAISLPAFIKYVRRSHTVEALMNLRRLSDSATAYYEAEHADATGQVLARQFPVGPSGWQPVPTPNLICSFPGGKFPGRWADVYIGGLPEMQALNFTMEDDIYFGYQVQSQYQQQVATGDTSLVGKPGYYAELDAWGDQNCNGQYSHFFRVLRVDKNGGIDGSSAIVEISPLE